MKKLIRDGDNEQIIRFIEEVENIPIIKSFSAIDLDDYFSVFVSVLILSLFFSV